MNAKRSCVTFALLTGGALACEGTQRYSDLSGAGARGAADASDVASGTVSALTPDPLPPTPPSSSEVSAAPAPLGVGETGGATPPQLMAPGNREDAGAAGGEIADASEKCTTNDGCLEPTASRCDQQTGACAPCQVHADCSLISGKPLCTGGTDARCVECLSGLQCAGNPRGSVCDAATGTCVACVADSDCRSADASRCVDNQCRPCVNDDGGSHCAHIADGTLRSECATPPALPGYAYSAPALNARRVAPTRATL